MNVYDPKEVAGFCMTRDPLGPLSNMAPGGFTVNGTEIRFSEMYFQAMKFPDHPDLQRKIIEAESAKEAKSLGRNSGVRPREGWDDLPQRGNAMRHTTRLKFAFNRDLILRQFEISAGRPIVEISTKGDQFWGVVLGADGKLTGHNFLGRIWFEIEREVAEDPDAYLRSVPPPRFDQALLFGEPIGEIEVPSRYVQQSLSL